MTIAALRALIDEELPYVPRHPAPPIPHRHFSAKEPDTVTTIPSTRQEPSPAPRAEPAPLPVGQLLAWGAAHPDKAIRDHAEKARMSLGALRTRHQADEELSCIDTEAAELAKRLAELEARKAELVPAKSRAPRSYDAAAVRAWALQQDMDVPTRGRVPNAVVDAWRRAQAPGGTT